MSPPRPNLAAAYDSEHFRQLGHQLVDQLADHLARTTRREGPVLPWAPPAANLERFPAHFPEQPTGDFPALLSRVLDASHHLDSIHRLRLMNHPLPGT